MRGAAFFPMVPYPLANKRIRKFPPDIAPRADFIPPSQYFFQFHHRLLSSEALRQAITPNWQTEFSAAADRQCGQRLR
jgi:hypothetical protein